MPELSVKYETADFRNLATARRGGTFRMTIVEPATGAEVTFRELTGEQAEVLWRLTHEDGFSELSCQDWIGENDAARK